MFLLTILEKIKETRLNFFQGSVAVFYKMKKRVKLTNKAKESAAKNKAGTMLRLNKKKFEDEELPDELSLTTRQTATIRNAFANSMSTDI